MSRPVVSLLFWVFSVLPALAQTWVQIEARPTEAAALDRARSYAERLPDVEGYRLSSGWFAVVLGPYDQDAAQATLLNLRIARAVPSDSFLADGGNFRERIFGGDAAPAPTTAEVAPPAPPAVELVAAEESPAQSQQAERALDRETRQEVQIALRFEGVYAAAIDGDFGSGTRRAMADWQQVNGFEPTGILSSRQRAQLLDTYRSAIAALGFERVRDETAGIEIDLPLGLMSFDRYDAPFAIWGAEGGPRAILISQIGDERTFQALFDILQTLEIMPLDGPRSLSGRSFSIVGRNDRVSSSIEAARTGEAIKGFGLVWPAGDEQRRRMVMDRMRASFTPLPGAIMPDAVSTEQSVDLLSGLAIRRADRLRSGFYVADGGEVLTALDAVEGCARVTYDDEMDAQVIATDAELGLALLRPVTRLAPISLARLPRTEPRLAAEIAVSGYSFGGILGAPSLTFGTFEDNRGLDGDRRLARLSLPGTETDAGGPVLDAGGAVAGLLLPAGDGPRRLPEGVALAVGAEALDAFLSANGIEPARDDDAAPLSPAALQELASGLTVLVSCWN